jgi:hypothetical protein
LLNYRTLFGGKQAYAQLIEKIDRPVCLENEADVSTSYQLTDLPALEKRGFACSRCPASFFGRSNLYNHYAWCHFKQELDSKYKGKRCYLCNKEFQDETSMLSHMGATHDKVEDYLDKKFHIARCKKAEKKIPPSPEKIQAASVGKTKVRGGMGQNEVNRDKESSSTRPFKVNRGPSLGKRDFRCSRCPDAFLSRSHLYGHYASVHFKQELTSKYQVGDLCPFCGKLLKTETFVLSHMGVAHDLVDGYLDEEFRIARCKVVERVPHCSEMSSKHDLRDGGVIADENKESPQTDNANDNNNVSSVSKGRQAVSWDKAKEFAVAEDMKSVLMTEQENKYNRLHSPKDMDIVPANDKDEKSFLDVTDEDLLGEDTDDEDSLEILQAKEGTALSPNCNSEFGGSTPERRDSYNDGDTPSAASFVIEETWSIPEPDGIHVDNSADIPEDSFQIVPQDDDNSDIVPVVQISDRTDGSSVHHQGADLLSDMSEENSLEGPMNTQDSPEDLSQPQESLSPKELSNSEGSPITEASTSRQGPCGSSAGSSSPCFPVATGVEDTPAENMEIKMETGGRMSLAASDVKSLITRIFEDSDEENNDDGDM